MSMTVVIVDDEPPARARIRRLLKAHDDVDIVGECGDGAAAVQTIEAMRPDLVFLDVQMPELDGFDVLRALEVPHLPAVIFVTAFDRYAIRAFEVHALDYVLKPVEADRLDAALAHARERLGEQRSAAGAMSSLLQTLARDRPYLARIPVRSEGRVKVVALHEVEWISAADNYVTLHAGRREYLVRDTIAALERQLDPAQFVRVHRSTIVRLDSIGELVPDAHGDFRIRLRSGAELALSRSYRSRVESRFGRRL
ncbi:MAG TPA: response regulator [Vicinamibacterales bacterium]|nr:response regulator [Vicinamibacterales bacterium]